MQKSIKEGMEQAADDGHECDFQGTWKELSSPYVAKLVTCSLMTRVVVPKGATEEQIIEAAKARFAEKIQTELSENIEEVTDDEECPYGTHSEDILTAILKNGWIDKRKLLRSFTKEDRAKFLDAEKAGDTETLKSFLKS